MFLLILFFPACRPSADHFHPNQASRSVHAIAATWSRAVREKQPRALIALFWDVCLVRCPGFTFSRKELLAGRSVARFAWTARSRSGSLAGDLAGQLASYKEVKRARVEITALKFWGQRNAEARLSLAVDGILVSGHRRSDRGEIHVWLERRGLAGDWRISRYRLAGMETLVSFDLGFKRMAGPKVFADRSHFQRAETPKSPRNKPAVFPAALNAGGDLDGDGDGDLILAAAHTITVWENKGQAGFIQRQTLHLAGSDAKRENVVSLSLIDLTDDGLMDLIVSSDRGRLGLHPADRSPFSFARRATPIHRPQSDQAAGFGGPVFLDANRDGRLDIYLSGGGRPTAPGSADRCDLILFGRGSPAGRASVPRFHPVLLKNLPASQAVCPVYNAFAQAEDPRADNLRVGKPRVGKPRVGKPRVGKPGSFALLATGPRGAWRIDLSQSLVGPTAAHATVRRAQHHPLTARWTTGCALFRPRFPQRPWGVITAAHNPWPWMYGLARFPAPLKVWRKRNSWARNLAAAAAGSVVFDGRALRSRPKNPSPQPTPVRKPAVRKPPVRKPAVRKPPVRKPAVRKPPVRKPAVRKPPVRKPAVRKPAMRSLRPNLAGWDTRALAADLDGDGRQELVVLQSPACPERAAWKFWVERFPALWAKQGPKSNPGSRTIPAPQNTRICALKKPSSIRALFANRSGGFSDLAWVLGLTSERHHQAFTRLDRGGHATWDLVFSDRFGNSEIFVNQLPHGRALKLFIDGGPANRSSIGARVEVLPVPSKLPKKSNTADVTAVNTGKRIRTVSGGPGKAAPNRFWVSIGSAEHADVQVVWPDGKIATVHKVMPDDAVHLKHPDRSDAANAAAAHSGASPGASPGAPPGALPARPRPTSGRPPPAKKNVLQLGPPSLVHIQTDWPDALSAKATIAVRLPAKPTVLYLFKPSCTACFADLETLLRLKKKRPQWHVVAVTVGALCGPTPDRRTCLRTLSQKTDRKTARAIAANLALVRLPAKWQKTLLTGAALPRVLFYDTRGKLHKAAVGHPNAQTWAAVQLK